MSLLIVRLIKKEPNELVFIVFSKSFEEKALFFAIVFIDFYVNVIFE